MFLRITVVFQVLFAAVPVAAAIWTVEQDGSGDFTVIQDAVDGAAPGDSIVVGAGRFDEFRESTTIDGFTGAIIVHLTKPLTVIGAGMNSTIVGPAEHVTTVQGLEPAGLLVDEVPGSTVRGIQFENVEFPVSLRSQSELVECRVIRTGSSFPVQIQKGDQIEIRGCEFTGGKAIITSGPLVTNPRILDCEFVALGGNDVAIVIGNGASGALVARCAISGSGGGIQTSLSGTVVIEETSFTDIGIAPLDLSSGSMVVRRCVIGSGSRYSVRAGQGLIEIHDSIVGGATSATILTTTAVLVRNSHLLNGGGLSVDSRGSTHETVDLANNWWGTADLPTIESWISQRNPNVIYEPILTLSVPTKKRSFSSMKRAFGQ